MEMRGLMGGFYKISEWIMRLSVTNILWIICSIPYIILVLPVIISDPGTDLMLSLILSSVIAPFTLFPATAAMFSVARKWVMGEVDAPLFRTFFGITKNVMCKAWLAAFCMSLYSLFLLSISEFI